MGLFRHKRFVPRVTARWLPLSLPAGLAGFDFDTDADCIFGEIVGALTGIARESASVNYTARAYSTSTGALVATSGTLTTDSNGRLPRWEHASLSAATAYHLIFVRASDGEIGCKAMTTT